MSLGNGRFWILPTRKQEEGIMSRTSRDVALMIVKGLDEARRQSSFENPVDEVALIEAGIEDFVSDLHAEIAVRDRDIAHLKEIYEAAGRREKLSEKRERAKRMYADGKSYREIAKRLGYRSPSVVHRMVKGTHR